MSPTPSAAVRVDDDLCQRRADVHGVYATDAAGGRAVTDVVRDPTANSTTYYAAVIGANAGIYRSMTNNNVNGQAVNNGEDGNTWVQIASISDIPELGGALNIQIAAAQNNTLYIGIVSANDQLSAVYVTTNDNSNLASTQAINQGVNWTSLGTPSTPDGGINPYQLGAELCHHRESQQFDADLCRRRLCRRHRPARAAWPNSLGQAEGSGVVFGATVTGGKTATWVPLVGVNGANTSPPGGTRVLAVLPSGDLAEGSNGGVYDRTGPTGGGSWVSHNGVIPTTNTTPSSDLSALEFYSVAYNPAAGNSIIGGTQDNGLAEQTATGADQWNTVGITNPNESVTPITNLTTVSPIGISGGQVSVADGASGSPILYASDDYFNNFFSQQLSQNMNPPPTTTTPTMLVNGSGGQTLYQVENNLGTGPTFSFQTPIVANNDSVSGNKWLVVGSDYVYESFDGGATWTSIDGLSGTGASAVPVNGVGPVTTMAYGGAYDNNSPTDSGANQNGSQYVLWVGSSGSYGLYLRTQQTFVNGSGGTYQNPTNPLVPQTAYPGGTPVGIAMNPADWTTTFVADNSNVYLATVPFNGSTTTGNTTFTSLGGPAGVKISGITFVPLPTTGPGANATDDAIVVSGWNAGNPNSTGVYELLVNRATGKADATAGGWKMVGTDANGVQSPVSTPVLQQSELPHVPVTAITYTGLTNGDTLIVTTEGRGVWTLPSFATSNTGYAMTVTGSGASADVQFVASTTQPGYFYVLMNGAPDTIVINGTNPGWPLQSQLVQQVTVSTTATTNILDLDFNQTYAAGLYTPATTPVNPLPVVPSGRFIDASTGTANTVQVEDDTGTISISGSAGGGTLSEGNSPTTVTLSTALTGATLVGGSATNTTFTFTNWSVPANVNGMGGSDTLSYSSNQTVGTNFVLTNGR